ncbi:hypothetical protein CEXT_696621 [Caerostris extrusa]|uniref:Peptidase A2 domain-containing protein n=1 Tax=Caerostris extrusa TaxID=172846 RepID=A0AAV4XYS0_CAEEX|nr:hypothetical protein CEXT_696621 [Caerostris extrusa]
MLILTGDWPFRTVAQEKDIIHWEKIIRVPACLSLWKEVDISSEKYHPQMGSYPLWGSSVIDHESSVTADKYLRKATINNRSVSCLLDTGASSCLLKESLAEHLEINTTPCKKIFYSFGNQKCPVLQSLEQQS